MIRLSDMATQTLKVDDLDGSQKDVETVTFGFDGATYTIDLAAKNKKRLESALKEFIDAARRDAGARRPSGAGRRGGRRSRTKSSAVAQSLRDWARENGYAVSERGRISTEIQQAYAEAHA